MRQFEREFSDRTLASRTRKSSRPRRLIANVQCVHAFRHAPPHSSRQPAHEAALYASEETCSQPGSVHVTTLQRMPLAACRRTSLRTCSHSGCPALRVGQLPLQPPTRILRNSGSNITQTQISGRHRYRKLNIFNVDLWPRRTGSTACIELQTFGRSDSLEMFSFSAAWRQQPEPRPEIHVRIQLCRVNCSNESCT